MKKAFLFLMVLVFSTSAVAEIYKFSNNIPPRYQWNNNDGYCGEVSLISAGLYYGQYVSQYDARAAVCSSQSRCEILVGVNDKTAATKMHLNAIEWNTNAEQSTDQFLAWIKQNVVKGYPVAMGIFMNQYLFYGNTNPQSGDPDYDHIVPVTGIGSNHPLTDPNYYSDDIIYFSDNGLWGTSSNPSYFFNYPFGSFQANRRVANAKNGTIYSLNNNASNYGIAITGVMDQRGDTLPVRVDTNLNYEKPQIRNGSNTRPISMPIVLTITLSKLEPHTIYNLYRYNNLKSVPNSNFNANASNASQHWQIQIESGSTYVMNQIINSNEVAVYRAVKATAP